jgi:hypothetical protein
VKRRIIALIVTALGLCAPALGLVGQSAHATAQDHIWYCIGVDKPVDMSYCQHNPWAYPPLNGETPDVPPVPVPVPVP